MADSFSYEQLIASGEGRLFTPLGVAYIVSILASMAVAMTITPVLCYYLLPKMKHIDHGDSALVRQLKAWDERLLNWSFDRARALLICTPRLLRRRLSRASWASPSPRFMTGSRLDFWLQPVTSALSVSG